MRRSHTRPQKALPRSRALAREDGEFDEAGRQARLIADLLDLSPAANGLLHIALLPGKYVRLTPVGFDEAGMPLDEDGEPFVNDHWNANLPELQRHDLLVATDDGRAWASRRAVTLAQNLTRLSDERYARAERAVALVALDGGAS